MRIGRLANRGLRSVGSLVDLELEVQSAKPTLIDRIDERPGVRNTCSLDAVQIAEKAIGHLLAIKTLIRQTETPNPIPDQRLTFCLAQPDLLVFHEHHEASVAGVF